VEANLSIVQAGEGTPNVLPAEQDQFKWEVQLETTLPDGFIAIRELEFLTAEGKPLKSRCSGSSSGGSGLIDLATGAQAKPSFSVDYELAEKVSVLRYKATCFRRLETDTVPVDIKVGLGL